MPSSNHNILYKLPFLLLLMFLYLPTVGKSIPVSHSFYIDSDKGDDAQDGTSPQRAWRTLKKLSCRTLQPGDIILFARGSHFDGCLSIRQSGQLKNPIHLTAYGSKRLPAPNFTNSDTSGFGNCIRIEGDYVHVEGLAFNHTLAEIPKKNRIDSFNDMWQLGALFIDSTACHCIIRGCEFTDCGVGIKSNGAYTLIEGNYLHDCRRVLKEWHWGPIAIWLGADHQQIRYNVIRNYRAEHPQIIFKNRGLIGADGGAIEIDNGHVPKKDISIHHNFSQGNQGFLEVALKDVKKAPDYRTFHIYDNISDDYQSFVLLWQGRECLFEHNTIVRRKRNGNEQGVFRLKESQSKNIIKRNLIITVDSVTIFRNWADVYTDIRENCYCPLTGCLRFGREHETGEPLKVSLTTLPAEYGARSTQGLCPWFDILCDVSRLLATDSYDPGMPEIRTYFTSYI